MTASFSVGEAFKVGWEKLMANFWLCCGVVATAWLAPGVAQVAIMQLLGALTGGASADWMPLNAMLGLATIGLQCLLFMGVFKLALKLLEKGQADFTDLFSDFGQVVKFALATFIYFVIVSVGLVFLIVPGIIVGIQFGFYVFGVVDKGLGPIDCLRYSSQVTAGARWSLFGLSLAGTGLVVLGLICLLIGAIPATAVVLIAVSYAYLQLRPVAGEPEPQPR